MKDPENPKPHWIVDDEAAAIVRQIFAWCMEGYGPSQIAHKLKDAKVDCFGGRNTSTHENGDLLCGKL